MLNSQPLYPVYILRSDKQTRSMVNKLGTLCYFLFSLVVGPNFWKLSSLNHKKNIFIPNF